MTTTATRALASDIDPVGFEVIRNALLAITEKMGATLRRAVYSTNIKTGSVVHAQHPAAVAAEWEIAMPLCDLLFPALPDRVFAGMKGCVCAPLGAGCRGDCRITLWH